jgi:GNAT superfamily N-acetyltransferase
MKLVRWRRFTWNLKELPALNEPLKGLLLLRPALADEREQVERVILSALTLDSTWGNALTAFRARLDNHLEAIFRSQDVPALVVSHGPRIIAASAIAAFAGMDNHLLSGPCVLLEYHNRGIGTALLHASLSHLRTAGLNSAHGIAKENSVSARFLYPKFGSTSAECEYDVGLPENATA